MYYQNVGSDGFSRGPLKGVRAHFTALLCELFVLREVPRPIRRGRIIATARRRGGEERDTSMRIQTTIGAVCSAVFAVTALAGAAFAGEEPYVVTVCDDTGAYSGYCNSSALGVATSNGSPSALENFYLSAKVYQFTHPNTDIAYAPDSSVSYFANGETFQASTAINSPEMCLVATDNVPTDAVGYITNKTARLKATNAGNYQWTIVLPKKPESDLNIQIQCGVMKPEETDVMFCAGEEGEYQGAGKCNQRPTIPGRSNIFFFGLPRITAMAYPGYYQRQFNDFTPFNLTSYRNPSNYYFTADSTTHALLDSVSMQVLDGSINARIGLKACFTKSILVKQPVTGQVNAKGQTESDLEAGDVIVVRMDAPRYHTMDLYCNAQSVKIQGIGDPLTLLP
jgi:hypothetical protein